jgi:putative PIN family toxin of toxin-antitoxin system
LVLDTQVWLDWLVFDDRAVNNIRVAVQSRRAEIVMDAACEAELQRVLAYDLGRHSISPEAQLAALAVARSLSRRVEVVAVDDLPQCKDPDDQKFIELAFAAKANVLVTKDRELLKMKRRVPFGIAPPAEFRLPAL